MQYLTILFLEGAAPEGSVLADLSVRRARGLVYAYKLLPVTNEEA